LRTRAPPNDAQPKDHYNTYRTRFGGWEGACLRLVEWKMGAAIAVNEPPAHADSAAVVPMPESPVPERRRSPRDRLRLRVLERDGYRCVLCGRSPALELGVSLHLDHIIPFIDGGETTFANLRTLCQQCNQRRGRSTDVGVSGG